MLAEMPSCIWPRMRESVLFPFVFGRNFNWFDTILHDTLHATKLMDMRINQSRSLPKSLLEKIDGAGGYLSIKALRFLLLTKDTTVVHSDEHSSVRRLEKGVWSTYIPKGAGEDSHRKDVIAYHWRHKANAKVSLGEWDVFIILKFVKRNVKNILLYLVLAVFLGVAINMLTNLIELWSSVAMMIIGS